MKASNITKGMIILFRGEPYQVLGKEFFNLGRGRSHTRAKLKNMRTGAVLRYTFNAGEGVEPITLQSRKLQYLYQDEKMVYFMDPSNFDQLSLTISLVEEKRFYLKEGEVYQVTFYNEEPIDLKIAPKVKLKVVAAEEAVKGDTVSAASKIVTLENGFRVKVPLFIKEGDELLINTETGEYAGRV